MKLLLIACRVLWRELSYFSALSPHEIEYAFLPQGLHITPEQLREEVQAAIDAAEGKGFDAIIFGYGICSNGLEGLVAREAKLVIPRAHDCITLLLGSKERHEKYTANHPGIYWYSPGWNETDTQPSKKRLEWTRAFYKKQYGDDNAEYLMETLETWTVNYHTAAYVDLGVGDRESCLAYTHRCAEEMGWKVEEIKGLPGLVRDLVDGNWDDERYLVVPAGAKVAACYEGGIVKLAGE